MDQLYAWCDKRSDHGSWPSRETFAVFLLSTGLISVNITFLQAGLKFPSYLVTIMFHGTPIGPPETFSPFLGEISCDTLDDKMSVAMINSELHNAVSTYKVVFQYLVF